ncbi:EAL domain-containing protein [Bacillus alkalicellulosilyticus]|uniref:EAL domain-containing protein n=1 Tax=Alkalihalobacterium alkalicellulosilyticum TaxID=1912214 RepID=UPI000996B87E|nr:EAL domain-containing protein [Bacillus alkalicellulosilyticus]
MNKYKNEDGTNEIQAEELSHHMAYHDYLTGLPNRNMLNVRLSEELKIAKIKNQRIAILFIDLDRFKVINDTLGHSTGDVLLIQVTERLKASVFDRDIVFRQGGDEFIVLLDNADREIAGKVAARILDVLSPSFQIKNYDIYTSPSIGISIYPDDGDSGELLIKHADFAMYQSKKAGKNTFKYYSYNDEQKYNPLEIEMELHKAIKNEQFTLHYLPKINLKTGKITGVEALIRWIHPEWGQISPNEFIPISEEAGLIIPIGEWVILSACKQWKVWEEAGYGNLVVSVNLSIQQFAQSNLVDVVRNAINQTGIKPQCLELEITESMTADAERTIVTLQQLKQLGVQIAIDNFGSGFSSLNYLIKFPVDSLKIDETFVKEIDNPDNEMVVKAIISMAHNLNMKVCAQGIETKEQLLFLQQYLCDEAQGYFFSTPLPKDQICRHAKDIERLTADFGLSKDINDRMWAEELIRLAKKELQETIRLQQGMIFKFKKIKDSFIHTLCDGDLLYRLGFIPNQVVGKTVYDFYPKDIATKKIKYYQRAWDRQEKVSYEVQVNDIHFLTALNPVIRGGKVVEIIGSCVDITERKKAKLALKDSERKYKLITDNMTDLITIMDNKGAINFVSPSHESVLDITPEQFLGYQYLRHIHPDDRIANITIVDKLTTNKEPFQTELRLKKNDDWRQFEILLTPIVNDQGEVEHLVSVARDITEKRKAEELLSQSEKLSLVGELASGVAHEIRNPLTSIKGFFQLFKQGISKPEYFDVIGNEFIRIENIINEFLTLGKPQSMKLKEVHIEDIINDINTLLAPEANLRNVILEVELEQPISSIQADPNQLKQVFINLLKNSMEAMPSGGKITVVGREVNKEVLITITDNGKGMTNEQLQYLGKPFFTSKEKGTGLGLVVCFQIIREHKGRMNFSSAENKGTVVEIRLPQDI